MKKIIIFFLLILNVLVVNAQEQCLTTSPEPPQWIYNKSARSLLTIRSYSLNIFVHIVRSNSGQGFDTGILSTIVNSLNSNYSDADIQFSLLGSEFIDNDYYYVNFSGKENQLFGVNSHCEAIDIYVLGESTNWIAAGMADDIPSTALIIHGDYYDTSSLPHEMGHCLGLYHTHHGTVNEGGGDLDQCAELVNGDNSLTCGDYIEDTAADPNVWSSSSCTYTGTGTDANGDEYSPDASNLMSYAYKPCRILFSELQIERMKDFIDNTTILQNVFHSTISGPSQICDAGTYSINSLPQDATVQWIGSKALSIVSGQGTSSVDCETTMFAKDGTTLTLRAVITSPGGCTIELTKDILVGTRSPTILLCSVNNSYPGSVGPSVEYGLTGEDYWLFAYGADLSTNDFDYLWRLDPSSPLPAWTTGRQVLYSQDSPGTYAVSLKYNGVCGWSQEVYKFIRFEDNLEFQLSITFSPNPTSGETTLTFETGSKKATFDETSEWDMEVYDSMQSLKLKKQKLRGKSTKINTQNWKEGVYMVRVKYNGEILTGKLIVKK